MSTLKKGQSVRYTTNRGRDGAGKITEIISTVKGIWYAIKNDDGSISKARPANVSAA